MYGAVWHRLVEQHRVVDGQPVSRLVTGLSRKPRGRRSLTSFAATPVRSTTGQKPSFCGTSPWTLTANRCSPARAAARTRPVAVRSRSPVDLTPSTKNVSLFFPAARSPVLGFRKLKGSGSLRYGTGVPRHHAQGPRRTLGPEDRCERGGEQRWGSASYRFRHEEEQSVGLVAV